MRLVANMGSDRVAEVLRPVLAEYQRLDALTEHLSIFAMSHLLFVAGRLAQCRMIVPTDKVTVSLLGMAADRPMRNQLQNRHYARVMADWIASCTEVRGTPGGVPQGVLAVRDADGRPVRHSLDP